MDYRCHILESDYSNCINCNVLLHNPAMDEHMHTVRERNYTIGVTAVKATGILLLYGKDWVFNLTCGFVFIISFNFQKEYTYKRDCH